MAKTIERRVTNREDLSHVGQIVCIFNDVSWEAYMVTKIVENGKEFVEVLIPLQGVNFG